jgi:hypothetical protein
VTFAPTAAVAYGSNLTVTADQTSGSNVYPISGNGVPGSAVVTLDSASLNQVYDGTARAVGVTTTPPGLAVKITYSGNTSPPSGVGSYAIVATITDPGYTGSASGTLTVSPAALTVTANNASRTYGTANPSFTAVISGLVNGDTAAVVSGTASLTTTATLGSPVGSYAITPSLGSLSAANYTFANFVNGMLSVTPVLLTVKAGDTNRPYGAANPPFGASYLGFTNGDTVTVLQGSPSFNTSATPTSPPGSYAIVVAQGTLSAQNYDFTFINGTLTVTTELLNTLQLTWAANGGLLLSMQGIAGSPYQVRISNDLVNWTLLTNVTADASGAFHVPIPVSIRGGDASFYQVLSQ